MKIDTWQERVIYQKYAAQQEQQNYYSQSYSL